MCVIAYKEKNVNMPNYEILKNMFENNPDGAGFMFAKNSKVYIFKGFMTFADFYSNLTKHKKYWYDSPFVLHFRISTQAGINQQCTHPFPLSDKMENLKKLKIKTNIGIAHNGIIQLTSNYYNTKIDYSDTMQFITDYLSLIINDKTYYKNENTLKLIEQLADSKLAILDGYGHCELIGNFIKDNNIYYSNDSYKKREYQALKSKSKQNLTNKTENTFDYLLDYDFLDYSDYDCSDYENSEYIYNFKISDCPFNKYGIDDYCYDCKHFEKCYEL